MDREPSAPTKNWLWLDGFAENVPHSGNSWPVSKSPFASSCCTQDGVGGKTDEDEGASEELLEGSIDEAEDAMLLIVRLGDDEAIEDDEPDIELDTELDEGTVAEASV